MANFTLFTDKKIVMRYFKATDTDTLYTAIDKDRKHLRKWLSWVDQIVDPGNSAKFILQAMGEYIDLNAIKFGLFDSAKCIGVIDLHHIDKVNKSAEIGYWLASDYQGQGIMFTAAKKLLEVGFRDLDLNRIGLRAATGNQKSRAIAEKLGLKAEGVLRQAEFLYDHFVDHAVYSMLKEEFKTKDQA